MISPIWIGLDFALIVHGEQVAEHGGLPGVRSPELLESALARPKHLAAFGAPDLFDLAASYAFGIARNHPFTDGNKRTALVVCGTFLIANDFKITASDADCVIQTLGLAAGEIDEAAFAAWLRASSKLL